MYAEKFFGKKFKKKMEFLSVNILGLTYLSHDSGAALLVDGKLLAAAEEERFDKNKHSTAFPEKAIKYCLDEGNLTAKDIDYVVMPSKPFIHMGNRIQYAVSIFPKTLKFIWHDLYNSAWACKLSERAVKKIGAKNSRFVRVEHHISHASASFYSSPFEEAAIFTADGRGEWPCVLLGYGAKNKINVIKKFFFPNSLGQIYQAITEYLGFPDYGDEYKVMGLSGYGKPVYIELMREIIKFCNGNLTINQKFMNYHIFNSNEDRFSTRLDKALKCRRKTGETVLEEHMNVASSIQLRLNETCLEIANYLQKCTSSKNLCMSGGVALNGVMNHYVKSNSNFENIYISPVSSDSGLGLGCALYVNHIVLRHPRKFVMEHTYWGPEFKDEEIKKKLDLYQLSYTELSDAALRGAELIAEGRVVGWFQGRMEYGPRALGNRSILGDPRVKRMKEIINTKVKFREEFRPFAPAVLKEYAGEYFHSLGNTPFMLMVGYVREEKKKTIPAVTHVDGTARVQTVEKSKNSLFASLIENFYAITGVPMVINTSLNIKGEAIVCTPDDAISCFYRSGIDDLIMGKYHISKA